MVHLLTVGVLLALYVHSGEAVKCYVCSSKTDPSCKDPFHKDYHSHLARDCTHEAMQNIGDRLPGVYYHNSYHSPQMDDFACMKAVTKKHDGEEVVRSCTIPRADTFDVCAQLKSKDTFCRTCMGDYCNAASVAGPGLAWALLAAVLGLVASR